MCTVLFSLNPDPMIYREKKMWLGKSVHNDIIQYIGHTLIARHNITWPQIRLHTTHQPPTHWPFISVSISIFTNISRSEAQMVDNWLYWSDISETVGCQGSSSIIRTSFHVQDSFYMLYINILISIYINLYT